RRDQALTWVFWIVVMTASTLLMIAVRERLDQVHVVLVYLLVVLGASATAGRLLAVPIAGAGVLLLDYFFQPPYDSLANHQPLGFVALTAFRVTAFVATHLLSRAQAEAAEADRRAVEIASLARLGSETLSAGRAEDALARVAEVIRSALGMGQCSIVTWDAE